MTLRSVLDTNVWIAAIGWRGVAHHLYQQLLAGGFVHVTTTEILAEISASLRFLPDFTETLVYDWYCGIGTQSELVTPRFSALERITACRDPMDNKFLECAIWGRADYLVSRDRDLLSLDGFRELQIVSPERFSKLLA